MPHVLLLCEFPALNGGEQSMLSTLTTIRAAGFKVTVVAPGTGPLAETLAKSDVRHLPLEFQDTTGHRRPLDVLRAELATLLRAESPDLLHANSLSMGRVSGPVAAELHLPSISHLRDIINLNASQIADLNRHTRLLAVSAATREHHLAQGLDEAKTFVLHNGIDLTRFQPQAATGWLHAELGIPRDASLVGTIGQLSLRKGQDTLARAAAQLAERWPQVHYLLIGTRHSDKAETVQFERDLHATFSAASLANRVHFLGTRGDVWRVLPELTMLVHPARQEPLGRVLLEASAAGVPVIATDVGGTREIFPPEAQAAILVPPSDAKSLADAMSQLLDSPPQRQDLSIAARRRAQAAFDVTHAAANLLRHYHEVLSLAPTQVKR